MAPQIAAAALPAHWRPRSHSGVCAANRTPASPPAAAGAMGAAPATKAVVTLFFGDARRWE